VLNSGRCSNSIGYRCKRKSPAKRDPNTACSHENRIHAGDKLMIVDSLPSVDLKTRRISSGHALIEKRIPGAC
jgi:hypothetical protein